MLIALIASLTALAVLGPIAVYVVVTQFRIQVHRYRQRRKLKTSVTNTYGKHRARQRPGKHRMERNRRAHRLCGPEHECAHQDRFYGRRKATYYINRARREATYRLGVTAGLHCGDYSSPSNFPGFSTPEGSTDFFTAVRTAMPRSPISAGR
ncbi:MAG TPA: hypothetical protein VGM75_28965 [Pseudonocardiaceae bacterium]|jgi:hypothetical protein